jgi:hypothetical protein
MLRTNLLILAAAATTFASEPHFGLIAETPVLPDGAAEIEVWNTVQEGADKFDQTIVQRLEFETGLGGGWQASVYLDAKTGIARDSFSNLQSTGGLDGFSVEVKKQLTNPDIAPIGTGLYAELGIRPDEIELETKFLADLHRGPWTFATNLVVEQAYAYKADAGAEVELELESLPVDFIVGAVYAFSPRFTLGMEARDHNDLSKPEGEDESLEWKSSTWSVGPNLTLASGRGWINLSGLAKVNDGSDEAPRWEAKVMVGLSL